MNSLTHGLVAPETWEIPTVSPLWTAMAYAAFDDSKLDENVRFSSFSFIGQHGDLAFVLSLKVILILLIFQDKDKSKKNKDKKDEKGDLKPVKEVPIAENEEGSKNESGCTLS